MTHASVIDPELLRRYDTPGPRYTSYPTAPQFSSEFGETQLREAALNSNGDPIPRRLSIYVHVPFCLSPCFYCGCNRIITRDTSRSESYLARLYREIDLTAALFDRDREVIQLHFGGGTPNFLTPAQLREVVDCLRRQFHFSDSDGRDISIELDPRFISPADVAELAHIGFNRASLGVQDFDPAVQEAVNRIQSVEQTLAVINACRQNGFRSVNVDLIYGLPKQNPAGFAKTLDTVIEARPDRIAVYSYAHVSIVRAVKLGRGIYDNIQRAMRYILAVHVPITGLALLPLLTGGPMLLLPLHVVFLELIIDPACTIAFEREAPAADLMQRKPRSPLERLLTLRSLVSSLGQGFAMFLVVAAIYLMGNRLGLPARESAALAFTALVAGNIGLILLYRSGDSVFARLRQPNAAFWTIAVLAIGFLVLATQVAATAEWFRFSPPPLGPWLLALLVPIIVAPALGFLRLRRA